MAAESTLETSVRKWCESQGLRSYKLVLPNERGWPDRAIILPGNRVVWLELKAPRGGRPSPHQIEHIENLRAAGHTAELCNDLELAKKIIESVRKG